MPIEYYNTWYNEYHKYQMWAIDYNSFHSAYDKDFLHHEQCELIFVAGIHKPRSLLQTHHQESFWQRWQKMIIQNSFNGKFDYQND